MSYERDLVSMLLNVLQLCKKRKQKTLMRRVVTQCSLGTKKDYDHDNDNIENGILYKKDKRSQKLREEYLKNKGEY